MTKYSVGDHVVYPPHGAGTIVAVKEREGADHLSIDMIASKMTLSVPAAIAAERGVRPVITKKRADALLKELKQPGTEMPEVPAERARKTAEQTRTGDADQLSNVLRDLTTRKANGKNRTPSEQKTFETARQGLLSEIALAKGVDEAAAGALIDKALGIEES